MIAYSQVAAEKLNEYLEVRARFFPGISFKYIFTLYERDFATALTEQKLNLGLKTIAVAAGIRQNVYAHLFRHTLATHLLMD